MRWNRGELFRITGLYLLIIPFFNVLNATGYVNPQIQGYFGASSTEFMYINLVPVFVLIAGLPLAMELSKQFPLRSLMYTVAIIAFTLNTFSAFVSDMVWYTILRSLLSFVTIFGIVAAIPPIVTRYNPAFNMAIMYGIFQFIIQGSSHLYKFMGTHFAQIYDWKTSLLLLNINFLICILLTWIFIKKDVAPFKKQFSFDLIGWIIMIMIMAVILYLTAEGQIREWFSDPQILISIVVLFLLVALYTLHSKYASSPLIDFKVFRYKNVVFGTLFFFLIGVLNNTGSVIMGFMAGLLDFSDLYLAETHLFTGVGLIISIPLTTYLLFHRVYLSITAIAGFFSFTIFHLLMYFRFYPGISEDDFVVPLIFKGMGIGFFYVLSSLYISENIPKQLSTSWMMSGLIARNVVAILLVATVLSTFISNLTVQHKTGISQQFTHANTQAATQYKSSYYYFISQGMPAIEAEKMANKSMQKEMTQSATLLAYKDIYLVMIFISFIPIVLILLLGIGNRPVQNVGVDPIPI